MHNCILRNYGEVVALKAAVNLQLAYDNVFKEYVLLLSWNHWSLLITIQKIFQELIECTCTVIYCISNINVDQV